MTPTRDRLLYAGLTTVAAAVVYFIIAQVIGDPVSLDFGHSVVLAIIFILSYFWAPRLSRAKR